jgi:hypothetical protein
MTSHEDGIKSDPEAEGDEVLKLEAKRAYNRLNAARARKRTKDQLEDLCRKVERLADKNDKLEERNEELMKRIALLTDENRVLRRFLLDSDSATSRSIGSTVSVSFNPTQELATVGAQPLVPPLPRTSYTFTPGGPSLWTLQQQQPGMF